MGIYFDTAIVVGVRLLRFIDEAWFTVKEHVGPDYQQIYDVEFSGYVGNGEFRVEWGHPASSTLDVGDRSKTEMIIWAP